MSAVEGPDLLEGEVADVVADVRELRIAGERRRGVVALQVGHLPVMGHHGLAVLGDLDVELDRGDADLERVGKGLQRVFGDEPDPTPMRLDVELVRAGRGQVVSDLPGSRCEGR